MAALASRLALLLALTLPLAGCVSAQVVKRASALDEGPHPTLLATYQVELRRTESGGGLAMTGGQLGQFGEAALPHVQAAFEAMGLQLEFDPKASRALDEEALLRPSNKLATLTGVWTHPEGSSFRFDYPTRGSDRVVAEALATTEAQQGYFASISLFIDEAKSLPADRAPLVKLSARVLTREGEPVLFARTEGAGRAIPLVADRSIDNLLAALDVALEQLASLKREPF